VSDVVIELPVAAGDEAQAFWAYLGKFMQSRSADAERHAAETDAPWFMMHSNLLEGRELKVLIFQQPGVAEDFSAGWALERSRLDEAAAA
jgi:hypothetical protein